MLLRIDGRRLALVGVLALAAIGLTQCRIVQDRLTGVDLRSGSAQSAYSDCIRDCNDAFKACSIVEDDEHAKQMTACATLSDREAQKACKKAELDRHQDAHLACVDAKNACKDACYNEGGGTGGGF